MRRELFGTVLVPILSFFLMGWMMGWASAPYDPHWAARHPKRSALMALAGPVANLILVVVSGGLLRVGLSTGFFSQPSFENFELTHLVEAAGDGSAHGAAVLLSIFFALNLLLFLFNLIPLPPLDGASVIQLVMSEEMALRYREFLAQPMFALLGLVVAWNLFSYVFWPVMGVALFVLYL